MNPRAPRGRLGRTRTPILLAVGLLAFILVPFALFGDVMDQWAATTLAALAARPLLSALLIATLLAADIVLPTPSSVVSTAAGAMLGFIPGAIASCLGMSLGCVVGYHIGGTGRQLAERFATTRDLERVEQLMQRLGTRVLVLLRAVPVLAEASVIVAGLSRVNRRRFFWITTTSNAGISLAYAAVGAYAVNTSSFLAAFAGAVLLPALAIGAASLLRRQSAVAAAGKP